MAAARSAAKYPVRKNDMVMVIAGRERGKTGKVLKVIPSEARVIIERLNVVKRHSKPGTRGARFPKFDLANGPAAFNLAVGGSGIQGRAARGSAFRKATCGH